ncbi:MAG: peptide chain release factor N(5)-glutamine methyltransferase [Hyphomonadaceae bacterium]|nr:peptide chain release factor N(5)-glutamine methyltransferase [Hyphomonadaceae bacterium]
MNAPTADSDPLRTPEPMAPETLVAAWTRTRNALKAAGVSSPVLDARMLVEAATGVSRLDIVTDPHRPVTEEARARLAALTARRAAREPLAYILGRREFWTLTLAVDPAVLCPRPETEAVVEAALAALPPEAPARVLDLGVGSGAILLAILKDRPAATGVGIDVSPDALAVARANAAALGLDARLTLQQGSWGEGLLEPFDVIVANPPYIATGVIEGLEPEVARHEPRLALDGGPDGLDAYRRLLPDVARLLRPGGRFAIEIGRGQDGDVLALARAAGLDPEAVRPDLGGVGRVVVGRRP